MNMEPAELEKQGQGAYQQGNLEHALDLFESARTGYLDRNDPVKAAEMANNLCVVLLQHKQPEKALAAVSGTTRIFQEAGDSKRAAFAFGNLGTALEACKRPGEAEEAYRTAMELFTNLGEDEALNQTAQSLSQLLLKQGRSLEAISSMQAGIEGKKKKLSLKDRILKRILRIPGDTLNR